jgi:ATP-dependent Clp protease ATP-binding subunit ClpB
VQSSIGDPLARELLSGDLAEGATVVVDVDEGADRLRVTSRGAEEAPVA